MPNDLEIAKSVAPWPISKVAEQLEIPADDIVPYGKDKAKLPLRLIGDKKSKDPKLVLVTATNPTPAGEGKTTVSIGLADALRRLDHKVCLALREPSLGPVFGIKGGAAGGGYSQVIPMEDINLHFTGDMHAITASTNLISAVADAAVFHGFCPQLDPRRISIPRCMDLNDRELRSIVCGLGRPVDGIPRQGGFVITAASEVMAILCLCTGYADLKERIGRMVVGSQKTGEPVLVSDVGAADAASLLLKDAIMPNLVQTLEHTPAIIHGGPFANIAHGCSSILAARMSMSHADITVTEAGFGADLGAEKFLDIKCREADLWPDAVVLVTTIRSLKHHGGADKAELTKENVEALQKGFANLDRHVRNLREVFGINVVCAINHFTSDTPKEIEALCAHLDELGVLHALNDSFADGGEGSEALAEAVLESMSSAAEKVPKHPYELEEPITEKVSKLAGSVYGAADVAWEPLARRQAADAEKYGYGKLPICVAKTQYSFSDDAQKLGAPDGFTLTVREFQVSAGAGFAVAICGDIMRMPGLGKHPAALDMTFDETGEIGGLF